MRATANSIYSFYVTLQDPSGQYNPPSRQSYPPFSTIDPDHLITWTGGTLLSFSTSVDSLIEANFDVVKNETTGEITATMTGVGSIAEGSVKVYSDSEYKNDITQSATVDTSVVPAVIRFAQDPGAAKVYVTFYGATVSNVGPNPYPVTPKLQGTMLLMPSRYIAEPAPTVHLPGDPTDIGGTMVDTMNGVIDGIGSILGVDKLPKDGSGKYLNVQVDYTSEVTDVLTFDETDPSKLTLLLPAGHEVANATTPFQSLKFDGDPDAKNYVDQINTAASSGNIIKLNSPLPVDAGSDPSKLIKLDYYMRRKDQDVKLTVQSTIVLDQEASAILGVYADEAKSTPNLWTDKCVLSADKKTLVLDSIPSDLTTVYVEFVTAGASGGNHIRYTGSTANASDPVNFPVEGVYDNPDGTGTNYFDANAAGHKPRTVQTQDDGKIIVDLTLDQPFPGSTAYVFYRSGGRRKLQLPPASNYIGPYRFYIGNAMDKFAKATEVDDNYRRQIQWDPVNFIVTLPDDFPEFDQNASAEEKPQAVPFLVMALEDTVYLVGDWGTYPMRRYRGDMRLGIEYRLMGSAGINSQNSGITTVNGIPDSNIGDHPFLSMPGLTSEGGAESAHGHYFRATLLPYAPGAEITIYSSSVSGPSVVDTTYRNQSPLLQRFGSTNSPNVLDWINTYTEVDPLEVLPVDMAKPDEGSGSSDYRFRVVYRSPQGLMPEPWLAPGRDPWNSTGYSTGVVLYLDEDGTGHYNPHFMVQEDPNATDPKLGITYIYRVLPQAWGFVNGAPGSVTASLSDPANLVRYPQMLYRALTAGPHAYFFGASDDYLRDWNGVLMTSPNPEPIPGPNETYKDWHDFDTLLVDRNVQVPGTWRDKYTNYYPYDCHEYPIVSPVLSAVLGANRYPTVGFPRFLGTLAPYFEMYEPANLVPDQFITSGLASRQEATFQVIYTNPLGMAPKEVTVWINNTADASGTYTPYTMVATNPGDSMDTAKVKAGILYQYQSTLSPGPHTYYFTASDDQRQTQFPVRPDFGMYGGSYHDDPYVPSHRGTLTDPLATVSNDYVPGPYVNTPPVLTNPRVSPSAGTSGDRFTYRINYRDPDGQRPYSGFVVVELRDGGSVDPRIGGAVKIPMVADVPNPALLTPDDFRSGVDYVATIASTEVGVLQPGERKYYFEFTDDWGRLSDYNVKTEGELSRYPAADGSWVAGPTITNNSTPVLEDYKVDSTDSANNTASWFVYSVRYRDADNDAPATKLVWISPDGGNTWTANAMTPQDANNTNYQSGVVYEFKTQLGLTNSRYLYYFQFKDTRNAEVTTDAMTGPRVLDNNAPILTDAKLWPPKGAPAGSSNQTDFIYSVKYTDNDGPNGQAPSFVEVYIDGKPFQMKEVDEQDVTYNNGKDFTWTAQLTPGTHTYYFKASDGKDEYINDNTPGTHTPDPRTKTIVPYSGPTVLDLPTLEDPKVNNETGGKNTDYVFTVTYKDPNGKAPDAGYPLLFVDDPNELDKEHKAFVMEKEDPKATGYAAGVKYRKVISGLPVGAHSFHFTSLTTIQVGDVIDKTPIRTPEQLNKPVVSNNLPVLSAALVDPENGKSGDNYKFSINYKDADGDAPAYVRVLVTGKSGTTNVTKTLEMAPVDASQTGYTAGVVYQGQISGSDLGSGLHSYHFTAKDVDGTIEVTYPAGGQELSGPMVNTKPELSVGTLGGLDPTTGSSRTTYTYTVYYKDADGTPAEYVKVLVDGEEHLMTLGDLRPIYTQPTKYVYSGKVPAGDSHKYSFVASDGTEEVTLAEVAGPTITANTAPKLSEAKLTPASGTTATNFVWSIKYADAESDPADYVRLVLVGPIDPRGTTPNQQTIDMARADSNSFKDGTVYSVTKKLSAGTYEYYFVTNDGSADENAVKDPSDAPTTTYKGLTVVIPDKWSEADVTPNRGTTKTDFEFHVTYTTSAINPSITMTLNLDGKDIRMVADPTDNDFSDGVTFTYKTKLLVANHQFYFKVGGSETGNFPATGTINLPIVNGAPSLTEYSVTPDNTRIGGTLKFSAKYTDPDGVAPAYVKAVVKNAVPGSPVVTKEYPMTTTATNPDYKTGVVYTYDFTDTSATKDYTITFAAGDNYGGDTPEEVVAPTAPITAKVNAKPTLTEDSVNPGTGSSNTQFTYSVKYTDPDNEAAKYVKLFLSRDGGTTWDNGTLMTAKAATAPVDGVVYETKLTIKNPGKMHYKFVAWDGFLINSQEDTVSSTDREGPALSFAAIELSVPTTLMLTQSTTVMGALTSDSDLPLANQYVLVTYFRPDGSTDSASVKTDINGQFARVFTPDMDNIPLGGDKSTPWTIRASWSGDSTYSSTQAQVEVNVLPAEKDVPSSVTMMSIPVMPRSGDPLILFDPIENIKLARYMPDLQRYYLYGIDSLFPFYTLGGAYWTKAYGPTKIHASGQLAKPTSTYAIPLANGWNQVSSVHITPVEFGKVHVARNGEEVTLDTAASRKWVANYAWRWDWQSKSYKLVSATDADAERTLMPWEGYWIRAYTDNCELIIPAAISQ